MNTPDITPLIKGVMVLIGIALALGQYPRLEHWARGQALEAMEWKEGLTYFFAPPHPSAIPAHHHRPHGSEHSEGGRS